MQCPPCRWVQTSSGLHSCNPISAAQIHVLNADVCFLPMTTQQLHAHLSPESKLPVIYKAVWGHFSVSCTPLKCLDDLCASVYTRTATVSASRLFDYEWSMPLQQNAQRPDTEHRANSSLARLAWFSSMAGSSVSQTAACLPASLCRAEPRPGGGQGPGPVRTGSTTPAGGVKAKHTNSYCNLIIVQAVHCTYILSCGSSCSPSTAPRS